MKEGAYPAKLTSEEGIAGVIREVELDEWRRTFNGSGKEFTHVLAGQAREVADMMITDLIAEHGSLLGAFHTDHRLREQLVEFENGSLFIAELLKS